MNLIVKAASIILVLLLSTVANAQVGFFAPDGLPKTVIKNTQIGLFNGQNAAQVEQNLVRMEGTKFRAFVDLGPMIARAVVPARLSMRYTTKDGRRAEKHFKPQSPSNLREFPSDPELRRTLAPIITVLARHKANVGAVFIADEPYTHGLSKGEMERAARVVRSMLDEHELRSVKIGVVFASAMFNREFAHLMDRESGAYVHGIDQYYATHGGGMSQADFSAWVAAVAQHRLVTYDRAGNMYVDGGVPRGYDIYGFDFYLSTLLLDRTHEDTLSWLAEHYPDAGCARFAGLPMLRIRTQLSFFRKGKVLASHKYQEADRRILDSIFRCRINAVTTMLRNEVKDKKAQLLLVSESSDNGVLEFTPDGSVKPNQSAPLVDARVLDEVSRAEKFYGAHECLYSAGLLFFTYQDSYDSTIKLQVGGARGMPDVMASIYGFAKEKKISGRQAKCPANATVPSKLRQRQSRGETTLSVVPGTVSACNAASHITSKVSWRVRSEADPRVRVDVLDPGASEAKLFSQGGREGTAMTGDWVELGTRFDLVDSRSGKSLAAFTVTQIPCDAQ